MTFIVLDFEMNPVRRKGYNLRNEIIEIGAVKMDENYQIIDHYSALIKPEYSPIAQKIKDLTGIDAATVRRAPSFQEALQDFSKWIGDGPAEIYGWSDSDENQFRAECQVKGIEVPANMESWIDFQPIYKEKMEIHSEGRLSLQKAAGWHGIQFDKKAAHRAGYDAEITAILVQSILTGEYIKYKKMIKSLLEPEKEESFGTSLAGLFGDIKLE